MKPLITGFFCKSLSVGLGFLLLISAAYAQPIDPTASKNLIILIGDGMGPSQVTLTRLYANKFLEQNKLVMDNIYIGSSTTYPEYFIIFPILSIYLPYSVGNLS